MEAHPLDTLETLLEHRGAAGVKRPLHADAARKSIVVALELSAIRWAWWKSHQEDLLAILPNGGTGGGSSTWMQFLPSNLSRAQRLVVVNGTAGDGEFHEVPERGGSRWAAGRPFPMFLERFQRRLAQGGLLSRFAGGVAGALGEMAGNAVEHSDSDLPPVAAYEVTPTSWSFGVADVGCGLLGSLRRNPSYKDLPDDVTAMRYALKDGVSATGERNRGHGFSVLFLALANRMCTLRLRSTKAVGTWTGTSPAATSLALMPGLSRPGFYVSVMGALK